VALGWLPMYLAGACLTTPTTFLLKDQLKVLPSELALFGAITGIPTYLKPLFGILSDAVPLLGTRRKHYLIFSALLTGLIFLVLALVPRTFSVLLWMHLIAMVGMVLLSTTMGGLMTDVGQRHGATGRMSAQRVFLGRLETLFSGPLGLMLSKGPYALAATLSGFFYLVLVPWFALRFHEKIDARLDRSVLSDAKKSLFALGRSKSLFQAAGLLALVLLAPGFGSPLLYYQTDTLKFSKDFLALLALIGGAFGLLGAALYSKLCRRFPLRTLLSASIVIHGLGTLFYLLYRTPGSALAITALEGLTNTLAVLPLYDLCARSAPKGSEALGYSVMMSVWNLTLQLSNVLGSQLYDRLHLSFMDLVWLNAGTTLLALVGVPYLSRELLEKQEGKSGL
jgi:Na+/melibiose symporter-like transporter